MKRAALLVAVLALQACGGGGGGGSSGMPAIASPAPASQAVALSAPAPIPESVRPRCSIVVYGDSVAHGEAAVGQLLATSPVAEIRKLRPDWDIEDRAIAGDSASQAERRVMNDFRSARVVVLSWGINDMAHGWDVAAPLSRLVDFLRTEGRLVVLTGMIHTEHPEQDTYNAAELSVASSRGAAFASWGEVPITGTVDGLHPDQASSDAIAADLARTLDVECARLQ